jgi:acyl-CoA dehydrogenase
MLLRKAPRSFKGDAVMDFNLPAELTAYLATLDAFIADKIAPLQAEHDNERFFDHRREWARTDWDGGGLPRREWEELLGKARGIADAAGHYRFALPANTAARTAPTSGWR